MHLKNPLLFGLMAILLLGGTITPAISQNSPDLGIVINEVELKSNSDGSNPSDFIKESNDEDHPIIVEFCIYFNWKCACSMQFQ